MNLVLRCSNRLPYHPCNSSKKLLYRLKRPGLDLNKDKSRFVGVILDFDENDDGVEDEGLGSVFINSWSFSYLSFGSDAGNRNMVQTRNSENNNPPDPIATQLAAIAAKLELFETMKEDIATLKEGERSRSRSSKNGEVLGCTQPTDSTRMYRDLSLRTSGPK
nr:retrotransposon Gag domain, retroviral aspartyl protease [Tanacetum cinerariifolium]